MRNENQITCPNCGRLVNINQALYKQLANEFDVKHERELLELKREKEKVEKLKTEINGAVEQGISARLAAAKSKLEKAIRQEIGNEQGEQINALQETLKLKSEQLKDFNKTKALVSKLQLEKEEIKWKIEAEEAEKFNKLLVIEREKIKDIEAEKGKNEKQKLHKIIDDQKSKLEEAQKKLDAGSNKLTGEVKEIELRDFLKKTFPIDEICDVPSGITGADVIHAIKNNLGQQSGIILYERKQTQTFGKDWISKLKEDGMRIKADACVLVTNVLPKENPSSHYNNGVWVCTNEDVALVITLLRDSLLKQQFVRASQINRTNKADLVYTYICSADFQNTVIGILDAFKKMDKTLLKEKDESLKKFSERESHIFQAKQSIISFWGRVDGITTELLNNQVNALIEDSTKN